MGLLSFVRPLFSRMRDLLEHVLPVRSPFARRDAAVDVARLRTSSVAGTEALARSVAKHLCRGDIIMLYGGVGTGKTTFARALIREWARDPELNVTSSSFSLETIYTSPHSDVPLRHLDLYRVGEDSSIELQLEDCDKNIHVIEWASRLNQHTKPAGHCLRVVFSHQDFGSTPLSWSSTVSFAPAESSSGHRSIMLMTLIDERWTLVLQRIRLRARLWPAAGLSAVPDEDRATRRAQQRAVENLRLELMQVLPFVAKDKRPGSPGPENLSWWELDKVYDLSKSPSLYHTGPQSYSTNGFLNRIRWKLSSMFDPQAPSPVAGLATHWAALSYKRGFSFWRRAQHEHEELELRRARASRFLSKRHHRKTRIVRILKACTEAMFSLGDHVSALRERASQHPAGVALLRCGAWVMWLVVATPKYFYELGPTYMFQRYYYLRSITKVKRRMREKNDFGNPSINPVESRDLYLDPNYYWKGISPAEWAEKRYYLPGQDPHLEATDESVLKLRTWRSRLFIVLFISLFLGDICWTVFHAATEPQFWDLEQKCMFEHQRLDSLKHLGSSVCVDDYIANAQRDIDAHRQARSALQTDQKNLQWWQTTLQQRSQFASDESGKTQEELLAEVETRLAQTRRALRSSAPFG